VSKSEAPGGRVTARLLLPAALFVAVVIRTPTPAFFLADSDGGIGLAGAQQIAHGEHPFVDFRSTYGPLAFYVTYLAQRASGGTPAAELLLCALGYSTAFLLLFLAARRVSGAPIALLCTALAVVQLPRFYKYYLFLSAALVLVSLFHYVRRPGLGSLALAAAAVAVSGLYRPDQGVYAWLTATTAVLLVERSLVRALVVLPAMIAGAASPWLLFLLARGGLEDYLVDSSVGAARHAAGLSLPFPWPNPLLPWRHPSNLNALAYAFWWGVPLVAVVLVVAWRRRHDRETGLLAVVTTIFAALSLLQSAHRSEYGHLTQALLPSYALLAFVLGGILTAPWSTMWRACAVVLLAAGAGEHRPARADSRRPVLDHALLPHGPSVRRRADVPGARLLFRSGKPAAPDRNTRAPGEPPDRGDRGRRRIRRDPVAQHARFRPHLLWLRPDKLSKGRRSAAAVGDGCAGGEVTDQRRLGRSPVAAAVVAYTRHRAER